MPTVTALPDLYGTTAGTMLLASTVLANDSTSGNGTFTPSHLTASQLTSPSHGVVAMVDNGTFSYLPNAGFSGIDSFMYTASDGTDSAVQLVTINVALGDAMPGGGGGGMPGGSGGMPGGGSNNVPFIFSGYSYYTVHDRAITDVDLAIRVYDIDNDPQQITVTTPPAHGTLTLNTNGKYTYTPAAGWTGLDSIVFHSNDGHANSNDASMFFTVSNNAPVAVNDGVYTTAKNTPLFLSGLQLNDTDPDGEAPLPTILQQPAHGQLGDLGNGQYQYIPDTDYVGSDSFTYKLFDGVANSNTATVSINVADQTLVANPDRLAISNGSPFTIVPYDLLNNDQTTLTSGALAVTAVTSPQYGQLTTNTDGTWTYTPMLGFTGQDSFTYTVTDGVNTANSTMTLFVTAQNPQVQVDNTMRNAIFSQDGNFAAAIDRGNAIRVWNRTTFEVVEVIRIDTSTEIQAIGGLVANAQGQIVSIAVGARLPGGFRFGVIGRDGSWLGQPRQSNNPVVGISMFGPTQRYAFAFSDRFIVFNNNANALPASNTLFTYDPPAPANAADGFTGIQLLADGNFLATTGRNRVVVGRFTDAGQGEGAPQIVTLPAGTVDTNIVAASRIGDVLVICTRTNVHVYRRAAMGGFGLQISFQENRDITSVSFMQSNNPDASLVAFGFTNGEVAVRKVAPRDALIVPPELVTLGQGPRHQANLRINSVSWQDNSLISSSADGTVLRWDAGLTPDNQTVVNPATQPYRR